MTTAGSESGERNSKLCGPWRTQQVYPLQYKGNMRSVCVPCPQASVKDAQGELKATGRELANVVQQQVRAVQGHQRGEGAAAVASQGVK